MEPKYVVITNLSGRHMLVSDPECTPAQAVSQVKSKKSIPLSVEECRMNPPRPVLPASSPSHSLSLHWCS